MKSKLVTKSIMLRDATDAEHDEWASLAQSCGLNFSLYPQWTSITARSHDFYDSCALIMTHYNQQLVGIFPSTVSHSRSLGFPLRVFDLVPNKVSYHNNLVSSLSVAEAIVLLANQATKRNADILRLAGVPDDSDLGRYLQSNRRNHLFRSYRIRGESSPYLPLTKTWEELLAEKPKKFRYKVRKRTEQLEPSGKMRMQWFESEEDCLVLLRSMEIIEENSWKKTAGISIYEKDHERHYHELLIPYLSSQNSMFANVLFREQEPIAYNLCCVHDGWVGQMKTSFDARFADLSPGSLVIDYAIQHALQLGASEFDFLGDADSHKLAWTKFVRPHTDYFLYLRSSVRGNLIGLLKGIRDKDR